MNNEKIEGFGSIHGGEFENIAIDGMGKLKGDATARKVRIAGAFKSKGKITAEEFIIEGFARVFREVKVKRLRNEGSLKLRRADVYADTVYSNGLLTSTGEISADEINIRGYCSVKKMTGDHITIYNNFNRINKLVKSLKWLAFLYFGRNVQMSHSLVDYIECTKLTAQGLKAKVVRAGSVELDHCSIGRLYCDSEPKELKHCKIKHIICNNHDIEQNRRENKAMGNVTIEQNQRGNKAMGNVTVRKILDLYKNNTIDAEEAELMLKAAVPADSAREDRDYPGVTNGLPWGDDGKLRFVAFLGRKLLKKEEATEHKLEVTYAGEVKNVECHGSLSCGDILGNASASQSISCGDIGGNASCGGDITCENIGGNVACAGMMSRGINYEG